jgi:hypothetical protein
MNVKKIILFLGAGASVPFDKPTTLQLKDKLKPPDSDIRNNFRNLMLTCEPYIDFEHIYYNSLKIREFLHSSSGEFFKYILDVQSPLSIYRDPGSHQLKFHETINEWDDVVRSLEDDVFVNYRWSSNLDGTLVPLCESTFEFLKECSEEIVVCTTNYDKVVENYCEHEGYSCVDGFQEITGTQRWVNGQFYYPDKVNGKTYVYLYKLHGSLDWKERRQDEIIKTNEEGRPTDPNYRRNLLIYPTLDPKPLEFDPFTTIINEFKKRVSDADVCVAIGFSFRDEYISKLLVGLTSKLHKRLIIIDEKARYVYYKNILKTEVPSEDSIMILANGVKTYMSGDNTILILHNIEKNTINDIIWAIKEILSKSAL